MTGGRSPAAQAHFVRPHTEDVISATDAEREPLDWTPERLEQERLAAEARAKMLFRFLVELVIGQAQSAQGRFNTASAVVIRLADGPALGTANHVIAHFERRRETEPDLVFQAGPVPIDLRQRPCWRSEIDDLAFVALTEAEANRINVLVHEPPRWPPPMPQVNDFVTLLGLPSSLRAHPESDFIKFGPLIATLPVMSVFENRIACRIDRAYLRPIRGDALPAENFDYGGMSGGPVFLDAGLHQPLVGLVKEGEAYDCFRIQCLQNVPRSLGR